MFSHPWNEKDGDDAAQVIHQLNETLTKRTEHHLSELADKRSKRGGGSTQGRAGFDICLVNRMEPSADLKDEPSIGFGKCAVSWHADSSLEHYSTIAVYQTIVNEKKDSANKDWSVALRVAHHAEGPEASRRGTDIQSTLVTDTPTISVSLPSGSAYYLLDDFNHHHQHAVISEGSSHNVRYSCTHRLLRQSHNVAHILERCQKTCSLFHKKGTKIWRPEQVLLTEIESEWIRQFYIQGKQHHDLLWKVRVKGADFVVAIGSCLTLHSSCHSIGVTRCSSCSDIGVNWRHVRSRLSTFCRVPRKLAVGSNHHQTASPKWTERRETRERRHLMPWRNLFQGLAWHERQPFKAYTNHWRIYCASERK
jgi:hypothetical protein